MCLSITSRTMKGTSMTFSFKLAHRLARLRAGAIAICAFAIGACAGAEQLDPSSDSPTPLDPSFAGASFTGANAPGIPFAAFDVPYELLGSLHTGGYRTPDEKSIVRGLEMARGKGARLILNLSGSNDSKILSGGKFSLSKWKSMVDRFKRVDLKPYIADGTLFAHYLIDEPGHPSRWGKQKISQATVEEMARYSKQLFPGITTTARVVPSWLADASIKYKYLDAAWAQFADRKGEASEWITKEVAEAKKLGVGLIVSLNVINGGDGSSRVRGTRSGQYNMSASELRKNGTALLNQDYACAFVMWQYDTKYFGRSDIKGVLADLSNKAKNHARTSCRGESLGPPAEEPEDEPAEEEEPEEPPVEEPPAEPQPSTGTARPGIPFGTFDLPYELLGSFHTGSQRTPDEKSILKSLSMARARGAGVLIFLGGSNERDILSGGKFSLSKWKAMVDRFKRFDLSSYVADGTILGHYLIDEPDHPSRWGRGGLSQATVEEMARYSKQLWPGMTTVVKAAPSWLASGSTDYDHLDAGWAQYVSKTGDAAGFVAAEADAAKRIGIGLIVSINVINGGDGSSRIRGSRSGVYNMSADELRSHGTALLDQEYACAFLMERYDSRYFGRSDVKEVMADLSQKAKDHAKVSCSQ
jgi:hypothetical protein